MAINYGGYELYHHGIKGQKWGIRRFQNEDGTLTPEGLRRYGKRYENREKYIERLESSYRDSVERAKKEKKYNAKMLAHLEKEGINGRTFKDQLIYDKEGDPDTPYYNSNEYGSDMMYKTKREAYEGLKQYYKNMIAANNEDIDPKRYEDLKNKINKIRSVPINERTYLENIEIGKKAATGVGIATGALTLGALYSTWGLLGAALFGPGAIAVGAYSGAITNKALRNVGVKKKNRDL